MPRCIFCLEDLLHPTEEHVFPESVGGTLVTNQVCKLCNDYLGSDVDAPLVNTFLVQAIRLCLGLEGKTGTPNPLVKGALAANPKQAVHLPLDSEGKFVPILLPRVERSEGKARISVDASQKDSLLKIVNKVRERASLAPLTQADVDAGSQVANLGRVAIEVPLKHDLTAPYRALIKIAYELGVRWLGPAFLDDPGAVPLRACLMDRGYSGPDDKKHPINGRIGFANEIAEMDFWKSTEPRANIAFTQEAEGRIGCCVQVLGAFRGCIILSNDAGRYGGYDHMFYAEDPVTNGSRESTFLEECVRLDDAGGLGELLDELGS